MAIWLVTQLDWSPVRLATRLELLHGTIVTEANIAAVLPALAAEVSQQVGSLSAHICI